MLVYKKKVRSLANGLSYAFSLILEDVFSYNLSLSVVEPISWNLRTHFLMALDLCSANHDDFLFPYYNQGIIVFVKFSHVKHVQYSSRIISKLSKTLENHHTFIAVFTKLWIDNYHNEWVVRFAKHFYTSHSIDYSTQWQMFEAHSVDIGKSSGHYRPLTTNCDN